MTELKPCPFCGGKAEIQDSGRKFYIEHECEIPGFTAEIYGFRTEEEAAEVWNDRLERTCTYKEITPGLEYKCDCGREGAMTNYCPCCGGKVVKE